MRPIYLLAVLVSISLKSSLAQVKKRTIPDFVVSQYGGSIGSVSSGFGYNVFKSKARLSFHYGIVPRNPQGTLNIVATKLYFKPVRLTIWNRVRMNPFDIGVMGSYRFGGKSSYDMPDGTTPRGYYWWNPAFRAHVGMTSSVTFEFPKDKGLHSLTGYVEFNTNEHYFISFVKNMDRVKVWDIVRLGTGMRINF